MSLADPLVKARAALLDHLPKDAILARYQAAGGQELISGKFANPESSAALVANAFGLFGERPELLSLPGGCLGGHEAQRVELEVATFTAEVTSAVADMAFCSLSYAELLQHWAGQPALADHAAALAARFDLGGS